MDLSETTPKMDLAIQDIEHLVEALRAYHALSSPLLQRRAQREAAPASFQGLLATVPRKSMAPMVLAVDGVAPKAVRAMPSLIRAGQWHDARRLSQHGKAVDPALGAAEGVLMVDGRAFPQQGVQSVGVKRQYGGELGKRAHCQAGGCIGSVSALGDTLLERRWYVPAAGRTDDTYAARRQQGGRPVETPCNTKPAWAQAMIAAVGQSQALRGRWAAWTRQTINAGRQGPRVAECAALRVVAVRDTLPGPDVWLGRRRHRAPGELKPSLCNAPGDTALEKLVPMRGMRWPIETCFEDRQQRLGMDDDAGRSWTGGPHHRTLIMLAHCCVGRRSLR